MTCRLPSSRSTRAILPVHSGANTPSAWFGAPAGLVSGPRQVEDGAGAHLAPGSYRVAHGAVVVRGEHEAEAGAGDALRHLLGGEVYVDARALEHVGTARAARPAPVAVLRDAHAGPGCDEGRGCRNVEGSRHVSAGARRVDQPLRLHRHARREAPHDPGGGGDLLDRLALHAKSDEESPRSAIPWPLRS